MKVEIITGAEPAKFEFPKLVFSRINIELIVLALSNSTGIVLNSGNSSNKNGDAVRNFSAKDWLPFFGTITLSND